jgi:hypothetical protein
MGQASEANVAQLTADAILQNPVKVTVCGREYSVAPPSTATLIEASKYIAGIPQVSVDESDNILSSALAAAADCGYVGDIVAILMLGKKHLVSEKKYLFGLVTRRVDNVRRLSKELLENLTPEELNGLIAQILQMLRVDFFFGTLTFLKGINQLRTKSQTAASGPPLPA